MSFASNSLRFRLFNLSNTSHIIEDDWHEEDNLSFRHGNFDMSLRLRHTIVFLNTAISYTFSRGFLIMASEPQKRIFSSKPFWGIPPISDCCHLSVNLGPTEVIWIPIKCLHTQK